MADIDYTQLPREERIKRASAAFHAGIPHEDAEAMGWVETLDIDVEVIGIFQGSLQSYEALNGPFVQDVRAFVVGRREAEKTAKK